MYELKIKDTPHTQQFLNKTVSQFSCASVDVEYNEIAKAISCKKLFE